MEIGTALQLVVAVAMPFVIYILHGIRKSVHHLRDQLQPLATKQAEHGVRLDHLEQRHAH